MAWLNDACFDEALKFLREWEGEHLCGEQKISGTTHSERT